MQIRLALQADAGAIASVHVRSWRETYKGLLPDKLLAAQDIAARARFWNGVISRHKAESPEPVFVAEEADRGVVGFAALCPQRDSTLLAQGYSVELAAIYLLRSRQGRGVGYNLFRRALNEAREAGHARIALWVLEGNTSACAFYERLGGLRIAEKTDTRGEASIREIAYGWETRGDFD